MLFMESDDIVFMIMSTSELYIKFSLAHALIENWYNNKIKLRNR